MKCAATMILAATAIASASPTSVRLTHSVDPSTIEPGLGVACSGPDPLQTSLSNSYWRTFDISDFGLGDDSMRVQQVEFGVEALQLPTLDTVEITVNFYETQAGAEPTLGMPLVGTTSIEFSERMLEIVTIDTTANLSPGVTLVVEVSVPSLRDLAGGSFGDRFVPGANNSGQTGLSYISSADCGVLDPTDLADVGFADTHLVMTLIGERFRSCCCVDVNGDGTLDIFDFLDFQSAFDAGDLLVADFDFDCELTIFDFLEFQRQFDLGCP